MKNRPPKFLKIVKRQKLSKEAGEARAHGDINENTEYDSAKEKQALNEQRIKLNKATDAARYKKSDIVT